MSSTSNSESIHEQDVQHLTSNVEVSANGAALGGRDRISNILWRILWRTLDFVIAGIFIYAGVLKALDPVQFANDIDNYKILPWAVSVGLAFYLPWVEIFCGLALVFRFLSRGALSILTALIIVFILATIAAKVRGLDITCGCFGHASQHGSFPAHLATDLAILGALVSLWFQSVPKRQVAN